jgi:hypothetical protein
MIRPRKEPIERVNVLRWRNCGVTRMLSLQSAVRLVLPSCRGLRDHARSPYLEQHQDKDSMPNFSQASLSLKRALPLYVQYLLCIRAQCFLVLS